jgi:hypothetical protein
MGMRCIVVFLLFERVCRYVLSVFSVYGGDWFLDSDV